jgi:hypothetical protein
MTQKFEGFHGTSPEASAEILESNFEQSLGHKHWIGDGAYFFISGISRTPDEQAKKWSIAESWDRSKRQYKYKRYSVIKSDITVEQDNFLDLTTADGVEIIEYLMEKYRATIVKYKNLHFYDGLLLNLARQEGILMYDVVKGNFYIKFAKEKIENINLRISNCTICAVINVEKCISNSK